MRKKSIRKVTQEFVNNVDDIITFTEYKVWKDLTDQDRNWCYDLAIIRLHREFENLILDCLIAFINTDPAAFSKLKGLNFPDHMNVAVCEYLTCGDGYFDFAGRDDLIKRIRKIIPKEHWLDKKVRDSKYRTAIDRMCALRNFAAHDSNVSKKRALKAIGLQRMSSSGAWLKRQGRFGEICQSLKQLAEEIEDAAPH